MKKLFCLLLTLTMCVCMMAGCNQQPGETENPDTTEEKNLQHISLSIDDAEMPVYVTVENHADFEGRKDLVSGSKVMSNDKGSIAKTISCADFGGVFFGSYEVVGEHLENATFCFGVDQQKFEPITCGINFYDLIMDGSAKDCETIRVTYGKTVELTGVTGDFEIFLFALAEDCPMQFGQAIITVSGTLKETGSVELTWTGDKFTLTADTSITNCKAVTEIADRTEQYTAEAEVYGTAFEITVTEGKPAIAGIGA